MRLTVNDLYDHCTEEERERIQAWASAEGLDYAVAVRTLGSRRLALVTEHRRNTEGTIEFDAERGIIHTRRYLRMLTTPVPSVA
jgi:IS30 family transposase